MRSEGGGFAANIYGAMPESRIQVTSHLRLLIPSHSSLLSNFRVQGSGLWRQLRCNIYGAMPEGQRIEVICLMSPSLIPNP